MTLGSSVSWCFLNRTTATVPVRTQTTAEYPGTGPNTTRNHNRQDNIKLVGLLLTWFGVSNIHMAHTTLAHAQTSYQVWQFGHWNSETADTYQNRYMICFLIRYVVKNNHFVIKSWCNLGAVTISKSKSAVCFVISSGHNLQGWNSLGSTSFDLVMGNKFCTAWSRINAMHFGVNTFSEPSMIWLLHGQEVPSSISNCPLGMLIVCICSQNIVSGGAAATLSVSDSAIASSFKSAIL